MQNNNLSILTLLFYLPFGFLIALSITPSIQADQLFNIFISSIPYSVVLYLFSWFMTFFETKPIHSYYMHSLNSNFESEDEDED